MHKNKLTGYTNPGELYPVSKTTVAHSLFIGSIQCIKQNVLEINV